MINDSLSDLFFNLGGVESIEEDAVLAAARVFLDTYGGCLPPVTPEALTADFLSRV